MSGAFAPLKDVPKSLLYRLARMRNEQGHVIPDEIIERMPTVQEDEAHDLPDYDVLDPIVQRYLEGGESLDELVAAGFDPATVRGILQLVDDAEFKRRQTPPGVKVTARAFGQDLSVPLANAWRPFRADEAEARHAGRRGRAAALERGRHPALDERETEAADRARGTSAELRHGAFARQPAQQPLEHAPSVSLP